MSLKNPNLKAWNLKALNIAWRVGASWRRVLWLCVLLGLSAPVLSACSSFLPDSGISVTQTGDGQAANAVPAGTDPNDDVVGRREHPRIISSFGGIYSNRKAEIMLARIVGRLLEAARQSDVRFTVTVLDSPNVNAFALPGGYIYVTRGILALANDENELAAVLAHEIAHVTLKHARARSNRTRTSHIVDRVVTGIFGADAETDQSVSRSRLSLAAFSQRQELQADKEGISIAGRAGYQPQAAARFLAAMGRFSSFASGTQEAGDDFLSSHPSTPDRIEKALASARVFGDEFAGEPRRVAYLEAIDGLQFGDNPNQGAIVGRQFIHPELGFTFAVPKGYDLQNSTASVVGVASDGEAVRFDSAQVPESMALADYMRSGWVAGLNEQSISFKTVNGIEAVLADAKSDEWIFKVAVMRLDGEVYRFIFATRAPSATFNRAAAQTIASFRRSNTRDLAKIHRAEILVVKASTRDSIAKMSARMSGVARPRELFLTLNNLFEGDPLVPGRLYKIVSDK